MAGDLHHYMRHSFVPSEKPVDVQHLLVNGGGGAFLHPTHVFSSFRKFCGSSYNMKAAYPSCEDSGRIALGNILKFRKKNWQFDFIGGIIWETCRNNINSDGDLEVFTLAVDKVPKEWKTDRKWEEETKQPQKSSHKRDHPSKWSVVNAHQDPVATVRIVDHFVINHTITNDFQFNGPSNSN